MQLQVRCVIRFYSMELNNSNNGGGNGNPGSLSVSFIRNRNGEGVHAVVYFGAVDGQTVRPSASLDQDLHRDMQQHTDIHDIIMNAKGAPDPSPHPVTRVSMDTIILVLRMLNRPERLRSLSTLR